MNSCLVLLHGVFFDPVGVQGWGLTVRLNPRIRLVLTARYSWFIVYSIEVVVGTVDTTQVASIFKGSLPAACKFSSVFILLLLGPSALPSGADARFALPASHLGRS